LLEYCPCTGARNPARRSCSLYSRKGAPSTSTLIELGACLDHEGSPHGSALMIGCYNSRLNCVRFLVRKGALSYTSNLGGHQMSCLTAARGSPEISHWLLIDLDQIGMATCPMPSSVSKGNDPIDINIGTCRTWSRRGGFGGLSALLAGIAAPAPPLWL
jgi:hypothetical protein